MEGGRSGHLLPRAWVIFLDIHVCEQELAESQTSLIIIHGFVSKNNTIAIYFSVILLSRVLIAGSFLSSGITKACMKLDSDVNLCMVTYK